MIFLLATLASARPPADLMHLDRDALFDRFTRVFEDGLPLVEVDGHDHLGRGACATGLVQALRARLTELTPDQRRRVLSEIAPWDLVDPRAGQAPPPAQGSQCVSMNKPGRFESEHFIIERDAAVSQSDAEKFAVAMEDAYDALVVEQGWPEPDGMDQYKLTAVINSGSSGGAYTTTRSCGSVNMPYIVTGRDAFYSPWYIGMAAHEFKHAIQYAYSDAHEFWFWEASATWSEEWSNPELDSWSEYATGYTDQPWISMHASSQGDQSVFLHMYGMSMWPFYLDHHVGGKEIVQDVWAYSNGRRGMYDLSQREALEGLGYDFDKVYRGFMAANTVMDYENHESFPRVQAQAKVASLPADGGSQGRTIPEGYGQNYIEFTARPEGPSNLDVQFEGAEGVPWEAILVGGRPGLVEEMVPLVVDADGRGAGSLPDFGRFEQVWLVVSPKSQDDRGFSYTWSADTSPYTPPPVVAGDLDGDGRADGFASMINDASACDHGGAGAAWLALGPLWALRRRRTQSR